MEKRILPLFLLFTVWMGYSQSINELLGTWKDQQKDMVYYFKPTSVGVATRAESMIMSYTVDWTKNPYWIDFTSPRNQMVALGLLKFKNKDTIWIENVAHRGLYDEKPTKKRRAYFSKDTITPYRKMLILVRQK